MTLAGLRPIAVTMGEPAGIAPDITLQAWSSLRAKYGPGFFVIGDPQILKDRALRLGLAVDIAVIETVAEAGDPFKTALPVLRHAAARLPEPGTILPENSQMVVGSIENAVALALKGQVSAIVTNPIHKKVLYAQGFGHTGHTDFIASLVRSRGLSAEPVMMLAAPGLRTVPLTVHIPLKEVARVLSVETIVRQTRVVSTDLKRFFGIVSPRIAITGLNPHAGEGGALGGEEQSIIAPAIEILRKDQIDVEGPLPADSVFHAEARSRFDVVVCMFHDQALIPVKTIGFHEGVNATLGLPIVRTSPDHGTALSLAGSGKANPTSLICAIELAAAMAEYAQQQSP
jgi:4-hydroxythreonine-4-phosphate dehydrogenase